MPYCPKCNTEYQEGYTMCADCKVPLVESLDAGLDSEEEAALLMPFFQSESKKLAEKLSDYFNYSDLPSNVSYEEENELYIVSIPPKAEALARQLYQAFYFVERENIARGVYADDAPEAKEEALAKTAEAADDSPEAVGHGSVLEEEDGPEIEYYQEEEEDSDEDAPEGPHGKASKVKAAVKEALAEEVSEEDDTDAIRHASSTYVMKADQYKDLKGTVWTFLFFGVAGIIFVCLNIFHVLSVLNGWLPNSIMALLFLYFLYVAISTAKKAKSVKDEIDAENTLTEQINEWLKEHLTDKFLKELHQEDLSQELYYIKLTETVKELLLAEFGPQNTAYLDRLIEDYYNSYIDASVE